MNAEHCRTTTDVEHVLKNYLGLIVSHCDLLLGDLGPEHTSRVDIIDIRKAAESASCLIGTTAESDQ